MEQRGDTSSSAGRSEEEGSSGAGQSRLGGRPPGAPRLIGGTEGYRVKFAPDAPNCVYLSILRADARQAEEIAMVTVGLLVTLVAKPGKEAELAAFVASALPLAQAEPDTTAWFAIKLDASKFGIVDVFPDAAGRRVHLAGPIAAALMQRADELLASPPDIKPIDVLAAKLPT